MPRFRGSKVADEVEDLPRARLPGVVALQSGRERLAQVGDV